MTFLGFRRGEEAAKSLARYRRHAHVLAVDRVGVARFAVVAVVACVGLARISAVRDGLASVGTTRFVGVAYVVDFGCVVELRVGIVYFSC